MLSEIEIRRKIFHLFVGAVFVALIFYNIVTVQVAGALFVISLFVSSIGRKRQIPWFYKMLMHVDRKKDMKNFPAKGAVFLALGIFLSLLLYDKDIAMASIIILAVGDSMGPLIGQYGNMKHPITERYVEGIVAGGILAFLAAMIFVSPLEAALGSAIAMLVEGLDIKFGKEALDDNISIPIVAGFVMWFVRNIL